MMLLFPSYSCRFNPEISGNSDRRDLRDEEEVNAGELIEQSIDPPVVFGLLQVGKHFVELVELYGKSFPACFD